MFLQEGLNLINWFNRSGVSSSTCAFKHVKCNENRPCIKMTAIKNGMTKNYQGVYRSESKENPIVALTLDLKGNITI